ncbi:MAG: tetratricopeptide repeat protein [Bacteroidetes bacterium]|nr:tetratricopeptide repeat protein [Bacteroidota bacterium]
MIALNELSNSFLARGMSKEALHAAENALRLAIQLKNRKFEGIVLHSIGNIHNLFSDFPQALEYFAKALEINEEIGHKLNAANNIGNVGAIYSSLTDYPRALENYTKALDLYREIDNKFGVARMYISIGGVYYAFSDYPRALEYLAKALPIFEELGNKIALASTSGNLGLIYSAQKDYPHALEYYNKSIAINEEIGNKRGVANEPGTIGGVYHLLHDFSRALEFFKKALTINEEIKNKSGIAQNNLNIGALFANKDFEGYNANKAEEYLLKALNMHDEIGSKEFEIHKNLADLYENEANWEKAHEQFIKYHELEKETLSVEAKKQAEQMEYRRKIEESERDRQVKLARFQEQEKILLNILPAQIAERILEGEKQIADLHEHVSVFFSDIVGFTQLSQKVTPDELLSMLNEIFTEFDRIARNHGLEKIKTIGDAYMAVAGVPIAQEDHAQRAAAFALEVIEYMKVYRKKSNSDLQIRVGLHCGKAIAGVIGENKFAYDLWGDSVNTASRMESHGEAGRIHVSEDFKKALSNSSLNFIERGEMEVKGKGMMKTYFLNTN